MNGAISEQGYLKEFEDKPKSLYRLSISINYNLHNSKCRGFGITGNVYKGIVTGVCNTCGDVLDRFHKKVDKPKWDTLDREMIV